MNAKSSISAVKQDLSRRVCVETCQFPYQLHSLVIHFVEGPFQDVDVGKEVLGFW